MTDYTAIATLLVEHPATHAVNFDDPDDALQIVREMERIYGDKVINLDHYIDDPKLRGRYLGFRVIRSSLGLRLVNKTISPYRVGEFDIIAAYRTSEFQETETTAQLDLSMLFTI